MIRTEQLRFLIRELCPMALIPDAEDAQWRLFRGLMNLRGPEPVSDDFLRVQDALLQSMIAAKGITDADSMPVIQEGICLWRGDITTLRADAVVNAANRQLLGCFCPNHGCIDNAIHTFAGVQLRLACATIMNRQGAPESTGGAKITSAYNLPSQYVLHTVGPIIYESVAAEDERLLGSCYASCLSVAEQHDIQSIAFCCISTGVFRFPNELAARIAVREVKAFLKRGSHVKRVIFNVFTEYDEQIYRNLLR